MKKKFMVILLLIVLVFSSFSFASNGFSDIDYHWSKQTINDLKDKKVITGYPDGTFRPNGSMTRAEFITVVTRSVGIRPADVEGEWYDGYLSKANKYKYIQKNNAIINEKPNEPITRLEVSITFFNLINQAFESD